MSASIRRISLKLLGRFDAHDKSGRRIPITGTKASLLLAYLALRPGEMHSRETLTALLWSNRDENHARGSFRQALWALRRSLDGIDPNPLKAEADKVGLDPSAFETDVSRLEALATDGSAEALEKAISVYSGPLLSGLKITSPELEELLRIEQMRIDEIAISACRALLDIRLREGAIEASTLIARKLLEIDPLQEVAHRALIQHYADSGQLSLAYKQYQSCREVFRQELNVEPGSETKRLFDRVRLVHLSEDDSAFAAEDIIPGHHDDRNTRYSFSDKPSIAVLPFINLSDDPEQEYFSDGITEDIIAALSRLRWFLVIARNSTFVYKGMAVDIRHVGSELGVRYVLEGSVRKSGNRVRVTVQLADAVSGAQHWAQQYDHELTDIFELQDEITQNVAAAIEPKLVAAEGIKSFNRSAKDVSAWVLVMRAMHHYQRMTTRDSEKAITILRNAAEQFPDYGPAHSLLAFALLVSGHVGWIPESDDYREAADLAHRAVRLDDEDPWAHLALGYLAFTDRKTGDSVSKYMRALDLNPNFAIAHGYLGWALVFDGQSEEAIHYFQRALRMSPRDPLKAFFFSGTGVAHYYAGDYDEAAKWARKAILERPEFSAAHRILCASLAQAGRMKETEEAMAELRALQPYISISWVQRHVPYTERAMPHFLDGMRKAGVQ